MKSREYYLELLHSHIGNPRLVAHSKASEAVMRTLARRFGESEELWGLTGLLHDIDSEICGGDSRIHAVKGSQILREEGFPEEAVRAVLLHNEMAAGEKRSTVFEHALAAGETVTGLIFAVAMVYPDRKISSVKVKSVVKRMKEKIFAASVKRENIMECEEIGIHLEEFVEMAIEALAPIEEELGF